MAGGYQTDKVSRLETNLDDSSPEILGATMDKLLKAGADPNAKVLMHEETVLMIAARTGNPEAVKLLLVIFLALAIRPARMSRVYAWLVDRVVPAGLRPRVHGLFDRFVEWFPLPEKIA